jgi:hypothetical protein
MTFAVDAGPNGFLYLAADNSHKELDDTITLGPFRLQVIVS